MSDISAQAAAPPIMSPGPFEENTPIDRLRAGVRGLQARIKALDVCLGDYAEEIALTQQQRGTAVKQAAEFERAIAVLEAQ